MRKLLVTVLCCIAITGCGNSGSLLEKSTQRLAELGVDYEPGGYLSLRGKQVGDYRFLASIPDAKYFRLDSTDINDDDLRFVARAINLGGADLSQTDITDEGISHLRRHRKSPSFKNLSLRSTAVTCETLPYFQHLDSLRLAGSKLSPAGLRRIAKITQSKSLEFLSIDHTEIGNADLKTLLSIKVEAICIHKGQFGFDALPELERKFDVLQVR